MIDTIFGYFLGMLLIGDGIAAAMNGKAKGVVIVLLICVVGFKVISPSTSKSNSAQDQISFKSSANPAPIQNHSGPY